MTYQEVRRTLEDTVPRLPRTWDEKRISREKAVVQDHEIWIYYKGSNLPHHRILDELTGTTAEGREMGGDLLGLSRPYSSATTI